MTVSEEPEPPLPPAPTRVAVDSVLVVGGIVLAGLSLIGVVALASVRTDEDAGEGDGAAEAELDEDGASESSGADARGELERVPDLPAAGWTGAR